MGIRIIGQGYNNPVYNAQKNVGAYYTRQNMVVTMKLSENNSVYFMVLMLCKKKFRKETSERIIMVKEVFLKKVV